MSSYKKNIVYNVIYRIIVIIIPLVTSPYISRVLGPSQMGVFTYTYSITYYFFLFSMLGVNNYGNREIAKARDDKGKLSETFWQIYYMQMVLSVIMSIIYMSGVFLIQPQHMLVALIQVLHVLSAFTDINWFAFGLEEFKITTIRSSLLKIITAICLFIFVHNPDDLWKYTLILQGGNIISLAVIWPLVKKYTVFQKPNICVIKNHIKPNLVLFLPFVASSLYQYMDKIMLGFFSEESEVGFYNYAENIVTIPLQITTAIGTVMLPHISNLIASEKKIESMSILNSFLKYTTWLNIGLACGMAAISRVFIPWFLGDEYNRTAILLMALSPLVIINGIADILRTQFLIPHEYDKVYTVSICVGAGINLVLNIVLIPFYFGMGASIATVVAYFLQLLFQIVYTRKEIKYITLIKSSFPQLVFGVIMFFSVCLVGRIETNNVVISILIMVIVGFLIYSTLSLSWMILFEHDKKIPEIFFNRRK